MIKLKKTAVVIFTLILSLAFAAFANAEENVVQTADTTQEYVFLDTLGLMDESIAKLGVDASVTRAQFIAIQARLMGFKGYSVPDSTNKFIDVVSGSEYEEEIYFLRDKGVISGIDAYRFSPDTHITFEQACAVASISLGYKKFAENQHGGYSQGYIQMAQQADVLGGFSQKNASEVMTVGEALKLLTNTAKALVLIERIDGNSYEYETEEGRTLIAQYCDIWSDKGIMTDNGVTSLDGTGNNSGNTAIIGKRSMVYDGNAEIASKIGRYVQYYYNDEEGTLLYVEDYKDKNTVITINASDLAPDDARFGVNSVVYYDGDKLEVQDILITADMIYNGYANPSFNKDTLDIKSGTMTLIDNNGDETTDVIIIEEYENIVVNAFDATEGKISATNGTVLNISNISRKFFYNSKGESITQDAIKNGAVLSYLKSANNRQIIIYVCTETLSGTVGAVQNDGTPLYTVDGTDYEIAYSLTQDIANNVAGAVLPEVGHTYLFRFDKDGKIAAVEIKYGNDWMIAYLVGVYVQDMYPDDGPVFRVIMTDGNIYEAYTPKRVNLNGTSVNSQSLYKHELFYDSINGGHLRQVVRIRLNDDGNLSAIETAELTDKNIYPYGYNPDKFSLDQKKGGGIYIAKTTRTFRTGQPISANCVIFSDPDKSDVGVLGMSADKIDVLTPSNLTESVEYQNIDFYEKDATLTATILVMGEGGAVSDDSYTKSIIVLDRVLNAVNEDDEVRKILVAYENGKELRYTEFEEGVIPEDAKKGDLARVYVQGSEIKAIDIFGSIFNSSGGIADDSVIEVDGEIDEGGYMIVTTGGMYAMTNDVLTQVINGDLYPLSIQSKPSRTITVYDMETGKFSAGNLSEVAPCGVIDKYGALTRTDDSKLVVYRRADYFMQAILIKE